MDVNIGLGKPSSNVIKGSTAKFSSPPEIEVMTSQQLFVTDLVNVNKNKVNVKSKLMDAFRAIRYNTDSTTDDTGWLLVDTARRSQQAATLLTIRTMTN